MKPKHALASTLLVMFSAAVAPVLAEDIRKVMEADNAKWLEAFNTQNAKAMPAMYTPDAVVLAPGGQPVTGRQAIGEFWEKLLKDGKVKDHTFKIVDAKEDGKLAYQVARYTLVSVKEGGKSDTMSGNALRVFERQPDGKWLTKAQIFN